MNSNGKQMGKIHKKKQTQKIKSKNNELCSKTKNVSWANTNTSDEEKRPLPSTPYPNATKKLKIANSTPISLSFDTCESDEADDISYKLSENKIENQNKKRKRSKKNSNWVVTSCSEIKPDKSNKSLNNNSKIKQKSNQRIVNTRNGSYTFNENTFTSKKIANKILKNIFQDEVEELLSATSDSESPDELVPIEVNDCSSSLTIVSDSSSDESSDLHLDIIFNPPDIKLNKNACQIIEPKIKSLKKTDSKINSIFEKEKNIPKMVKPQITEETRKEIVPANDSVTKLPNINILDKLESFLSETYCIIILKHPFKLYFNGKLSVVVLSGKIEVLGHILEYDNETESEIYNPRGQSFLCLETLKSKRNPNISTILEKYLDEKNIVHLCNTLKDNDCVIAVRNLKNKMTEYLEKHIAQHLYPNTLQFDKRPLMKLENELNCLLEVETASLKLYKKHEDWPKLVNTSLLKVKENNSRTILCGGKNVGKSTLLRYMINNMLNQVDKVVCIDLDPGQSEFTISGCVSVTILDSPIFGPNYTHLKNPEKSFFIGDVNVTNVLDRYVVSVKQLLDYCEENISKELPWIINCMGFSKSIGTDIIVLIIKLLKPSIVVQLESAKSNRNYNSHLTQEFVENFTPSFPLQIPNDKITYSLKIINSLAEEIVSGEWISEPRLLREMCILSYFSQMLGDKKEITAAVPYGVKLSLIKLHNINYSKEHILATFNGNLVALCNSNETSIETNTPLVCHGFGIVRGIDKQSDELYLLTPIQESRLENVNTLVRGNIALPPSVFMTTGHQGLVPYIQLGTLQGTSAFPKRSFISWKVLLKKN